MNVRRWLARLARVELTEEAAMVSDSEGFVQMFLEALTASLAS